MAKGVLRSLLVLYLGVGCLYAQTARHAPQHSKQPARRAESSRSLLHPASLNQKAPETYRVRFLTTKGIVVVEVKRVWAPLGADRFYNLVKNGFYTDASFFRVLPGFVVQFGISARPAVSKAWDDAKIKDDPVTQSNLRGTLTFATSGPNTRTTQVFINLADNPRLDSMGFSPFGKVVEGMQVVDQFYSGYGEGAPQGNGPDQGRITNQGKTYLDRNFPKLDSIKSAVIERAPAASHTVRKTVAPAKKTAAHKETP
jgi:cyclophilin family peptidyl-prolyl cis-trans isomerase